MWSKSKSLMLSSILVKLVLACLLLSLIFIPYAVKFYDNHNIERGSVFVPLLIVSYVFAISGLAAVACLNRLLSNIGCGKIFINENTKILRALSYCSFAVSIDFFVFGFFRPLAFLIFFAAAFFALTLRVLKNVFAQAVELQEENSYTI